MILEEKRGNHSIVYLYDEKSEPVGFEYDGTLYIYIKNGTADITGIADEDGNLLCSYVYEGYGKCDIIEYDESSIGEINPLRYRGYYYDEESGFYYLNSRYYDPETGRFISPDDVSYLGASGTVLSYNLFSYCENNPVNNVDYTGHSVVLARVVYGIIGGLIGFLFGKIISTVLKADSKKSKIIMIISTGIGMSLGATFAPMINKYLLKLVKKYSSYTLNEYNTLKKLSAGTGTQNHHLLEKRFAKKFNLEPKKMLSINLTPEQHLKFTNAFRHYLPYGKWQGYSNANLVLQLTKAMIKAYKGYPSLLFGCILSMME